MKCYYNLSVFFSDVVRDYEDSHALIYDENVYNYSEMAVWIDCYVIKLQKYKLRKGDVIVIASNKEPATYALMHAALRLGVAYVNIDIGSPKSRNSAIIKTCESTIIFFDDDKNRKYVEELSVETKCRHVYISIENTKNINRNSSIVYEPEVEFVDGQTIAYIMFTSGSTGIPKGVAVTHDNVLSFIKWGSARFNISESDIFANLSPLYFDNSVFDFYIGHFSGAALAPVKREMLTRPYELVEYLEQKKCTIWFSVPTLLIYLFTMKAISAGKLPTIRCFIFGGEGYPKSELINLYNLYSDQARLTNVYGPTECTCICSSHEIVDSDFIDMNGLPTLGTINENIDYRILDDTGNDSNEGELCLIGPNVAAGYFNDLGRTDEVFEALFEAHWFMKSMYRTGDIVSCKNNNLYFIGRKDNQIKHMGYRIELEEIENAINSHSCVNQVVVIYKREKVSYGKIVAYFSVKNNLNIETLKFYVAERLPEYMLPGIYVVLDELPLNANGKLDRKSLLALRI